MAASSESTQHMLSTTFLLEGWMSLAKLAKIELQTENPTLLWKIISDFTVNPGTLLSSNHRYTVSSGCHLGPTKES